ncbi:unnamed protein product [Rotaria sp. Silwood2]|nr:unnamed protein product [Rotaria sp. Silwood2]
MAFKGTWHRGDGGGGGASGDRRYTSSTDSFSSFVIPPQGVPGNQMGLAPMNYQTNPNAMYSVMNPGSSMMPSANYSSATKSLPYTGTVSNMYRDFGVIDNEISFKLNTVSGPLPRVGDRVVCQMKPAEGFGTQTPYKYYGFEVRSVQTPTDTRRPSRPTGGPQQMSRNTDSYMNRNQNRNQPSNVKRPLPNNNNNNIDHHHQYNNNNQNRDRHGPMNNSSINERRRSSPVRRSRSRTNKVMTPKRSSRAPPPKYTCTLPKASLDCSELNLTQIRSRYTRLHIPSDFYHASYSWHQAIPLDHPLKFITPCSFHVFNKNVPRLFNDNVSIIDPPDVNYTWNVRVMLMSSPDIQTLISRSCLINNENGKTLTINPDDLEHPTKLIKFLVGVRYQNEYFPLGGPWSPSLDGSNPENDPQVLIRTAIRCVQAQTGIDLSKSELKARGQHVTGLKSDLKKRLAKNIQQERIDEEKPESSADNNDEQQSSTTPTETGSNTTKIETKEHTQADIDKLRKEIEAKYQLPSHRTILVHPTIAKGDKFDCRIVSLHYLLNYANKDTIKEKCFELYLFSEAFNEMLMRDYSYHIYRSLYSCLEVKDTNIETETTTTEHKDDQQEQNETKIDNKEEQIESMITSNDDVILPGLDLNTEENEKKRKRSTSEEDSSSQRKKSTQEETMEKSPNDEQKSTLTIAQTRQRTIHPELLLAFTFFDRNRCSYLTEKDLEEILLLSGLSLTKNEAKMLVSRIAHNEKVPYHQLTDKALPIDDYDNANHIETNETDIDPLSPKGNLLLLPQHMSIFGLRSSITNNGNQLITSVDNQRAMKQLEMSNKIQTGLELKIDTLKKEIHKLTDELHATQKSSRSYSDQLTDTKKRLRDTQHDLKELEDKYKRYSDALYRVRSESRSTFDHLTHVLGIKEKQPSQTRKSEDDTKKNTGMKTEAKSSNELDKTKQTEKPIDQESITKVEDNKKKKDFTFKSFEVFSINKRKIMWTTGTTHMIARLTGSTLFANHNLISVFGFDHRLAFTTNEKTPSSDHAAESWHLVARLRDLRARTPYALFIKDNYNETSKKYPGLKMIDITKKISEAWRNLPDDKKQTYVKLSQDEKAIYEKERNRLSATDLQKLDTDKKARRIENRVKKSIQQLPTKKPRTAFVHFMSSLDRGNADLGDFMKGVAQRWSQMTVQDKQQFEDLHQEEKQQYTNALVAWASYNDEASKPKTRRSSSSASSKQGDNEIKKTSSSRKRVVKKKTTGLSKSPVATTKSIEKKSTKGKSDKEKLSSSSSDGESLPIMKKSDKTTDSKKS